ncbi:hypothetical protein GCM10027445_58070 [Amycolatopsis endophytica]|uniref:Uncharacterized protein n=1 Tax=Amycolatopsis endophytica TaxID=860233 RepID=A0A853AZH4_9PSEU|nr:hypothetical protein [Amycolatopsis endophytica]NYI87896.1 hypothetical protein [Amycolatopsis endophytica]
MENLAPEDFDLDLRISAPTQEGDLLTNKSGFSDICATLWPSC